MFKDKTMLTLVVLNIMLAVLVGFLLQSHHALGSGAPANPEPAVEQTEPEYPPEPLVEPDSSKIRICLDPGHTIGKGKGNTPFFGANESEIVWVIATMLETRLTELGYEVIKTREDPYAEVELPARSKLANDFGADLLLSLHSDLGGFTGYAFYVPDVPGQNEEKTGPPAAVRTRSRELAEGLDREIQQVGPIKSSGVKSEELTYAGGIQGALTISIYAEVPVMTLELGFLDNETDGPFLASAKGKILWVEALAEAIATVLPPAAAPVDN